MLVGKDHTGGKDHAGGEGSWCWERIMLVLEDDYFCKILISVQKNYVVCTQRTPVCLFATKAAANYMSSRARPDPTHFSDAKKIPCPDRPEIL